MEQVRIEKDGEESKKRKLLEGEILKISSQLRQLEDLNKDRENGMDNYKSSANKYKILAETNAERYE